MSIPPLCPRVADLLASIRRQGGSWTTHRVLRAHEVNGHSAPRRATARRDLDVLVRAGYLRRHHEDKDRIHYTLNPSKGGA
ncbi:hypothetical protein [Streptomyces sp. NPDC002537]